MAVKRTVLADPNAKRRNSHILNFVNVVVDVQILIKHRIGELTLLKIMH